MTAITSIHQSASLERYLGFPILTGRVWKEDFHFILEKLQTSLSSWKTKLLNKVGKLTLAKSVPNSIPVYYMQIQWLPTSICNQTDRVSRDFIWKGSSRRGINLVGWPTISKPMQLGGLGVRRAREVNTTMLDKLVWDLYQQTPKPWAQLILSKYCLNNQILETPQKQGSPVYNSIFQVVFALRDDYKFILGNGESSFQSSHWCICEPLNNLIIVNDQDTHLCIRVLYVQNSCHLDNIATSIPDHLKIDIFNSHLVLHEQVQENLLGDLKWMAAILLRLVISGCAVLTLNQVLGVLGTGFGISLCLKKLNYYSGLQVTTLSQLFPSCFAEGLLGAIPVLDVAVRMSPSFIASGIAPPPLAFGDPWASFLIIFSCRMMLGLGLKMRLQGHSRSGLWLGSSGVGEDEMLRAWDMRLSLFTSQFFRLTVCRILCLLLLLMQGARRMGSGGSFGMATGTLIQCPTWMATTMTQVARALEGSFATRLACGCLASPETWVSQNVFMRSS